MRRHLFSSAVTSVSMAMVGILAAVAVAGSADPASTAPTNLRYGTKPVSSGAYRGSISRSGKPRGTYNKRGLSTSARKRGIAGSKKRWRRRNLFRLKGRGK